MGVWSKDSKTRVAYMSGNDFYGSEVATTVAAPTVARIELASGAIVVIALNPAGAPQTVRNFAGKAASGFYDGLTFHRVVPDFVVQGGDPHGDGEGGPGYTIRDEINERPYLRGTLGMALEGLRDLSVIATAPQRRLAIKTFVRDEDRGVIREAVLRDTAERAAAEAAHGDLERDPGAERGLLEDQREVPPRECGDDVAESFHIPGFVKEVLRSFPKTFVAQGRIGEVGEDHDRGGRVGCEEGTNQLDGILRRTARISDDQVRSEILDCSSGLFPGRGLANDRHMRKIPQ